MSLEDGLPSATSEARPDMGVVPWAAKGTMAFLDQALFAGSHFVLNILLARWLAPSEYGAFAAAYSVFLLVASVQGALFIEPMMVFGAGRFRDRFRAYFRRLFLAHVLVMGPVSLGLLLLGVLWGTVGGSDLSEALIGVAVAGFFLLVLWLIRRAHFTRLEPGWATLGGVLYAGLLIGAVVGLHRADALSAVSSLAAMGVTAGFTGLVLLVPLSRGSRGWTSDPGLRVVARVHWEYGRWTLPTVAPMWVTGNVYYLLLPVFVGLAGSGAFRAMINLAMPALHTFMALSLLLLPVLARARQRGGTSEMLGPMRTVMLAYLGGSVLYLAFLLLFGESMVALLYGGQYSEHGTLTMLLVGLIPLAAAVHSVFAKGLHALERPDLVFRGYLAAGLVAVVGGGVLVGVAGVEGALLAMLLASSVGAWRMVKHFRRITTQG